MRENSIVRWLERFPQIASEHLVLGIGDDAATLHLGDTQDLTVVTTDLIADGSHFRSEDHSAAQIGRKAMAVNLSDIAAMAASPVAAFVSLLLPVQCSETYVQELMSSAIELANSFGCTVAGGDTNVWNGPLAVNVLIIGRTTGKAPLQRSGAKPNDRLMVTGELGGSIHGHQFEFIPRIQEALWLHTNFEIDACMDLSDGLALDLQRLCSASGCGAEIRADWLPVSSRVTGRGEAAIHAALGDGEDFELLLAASPDESERVLQSTARKFDIHVIGTCTKDKGIWLSDANGRRPMPQLGFEHH